jgi:uncharacterized protein YegP (UPF0339 family)
MTTPGAHERARIMVDVYRAPEGFRWRIKSSARGRRIISQSSEAYADKRHAIRGLLLTTGGEYRELFRTRHGNGEVLTQGVIVRGIPGGLVEEIFVQYVSGVQGGDTYRAAKTALNGADHE